MKNLIISLAALVAVGCSKTDGYDPEDPKNDPRVQALVSTEWEYFEVGVIKINVEFASATYVWLSKTTYRRDTSFPIEYPRYLEYERKAYCYNYTVADDGNINMKIAALSDWYPDDGLLHPEPSDYKDMPPLMGYISGTSMSLLKTDGTTYATLGKKIN